MTSLRSSTIFSRSTTSLVGAESLRTREVRGGMDPLRYLFFKCQFFLIGAVFQLPSLVYFTFLKLDLHSFLFYFCLF